jgi:mannosyltransferase OCH1-like enzyme
MNDWKSTHFQHRTQYIPRILHLVWVGNAGQPDYLPKHIETWRELMPTWTIRLWTNDDLIADEVETDVLSKISEAERGTQKADILKYYVVWKHGGIYVDADVEPTSNLDPIVYMSELVLCHDNIITWEYISCGFFAGSVNHPALRKAVDICLRAQLNTNEPHMTTGPYALGLAVSQVPPQNMKYMNLEFECFYRHNDGLFPNRFGRHFYACAWDQ